MPQRLHTLVVSANNVSSLKANISALCNHLVHPRVSASLPDLAYTLSERRSRLWHRAYVTTDTSEDLDESQFVVAKRTTQNPKVALVFTGQGAQWPQMGKDLVALFPKQAVPVLEELDAVLQGQPDPPRWSLLAELSQPRTAEHLRQPEFSQPLVTALQLCLLEVLRSWGVEASAVVGHSSGEIAAAYAAGLLDRAGAIKAAFYRGRAAVNCKAQGRVQDDVGMLAVGLGAQGVAPFLEKLPAGSKAWVACYNSPSSVTVSGDKGTLEALAGDIKAAGHFARALHVDLAYHSPLMGAIGDEYQRLLDADQDFKPSTINPQDPAPTALALPHMFSSVTMSAKTSAADAGYWKDNMVSSVRFAEALERLVADEAPTVIVELGPSGALAGPVSQVLQSSSKTLSSGGGAADVSYSAAWARGKGASKALMDVAGRLLAAGAPIDMTAVNSYDRQRVRVLVDLPNYQWNHSVRYWHENAASSDWRTKRFITHDLLGSKIPGTSWRAPTWRKKLRLADVPWLRDHRMGPDVLIPGTAFVTMALEAMYQKYCSTPGRAGEMAHADGGDGLLPSPNQLAYRFRNVKFDRAVVVEDSQPVDIVVTLASVPGSRDWHEFRIRTTTATHDVVYEHCSGLVRVQEALPDDEYALRGDQLAPLRHPQSPAPWYKLQTSIGTHFGPSFQKIKQWESVSGQRRCRAVMSLEPPPSRWDPQTYYPIHPAVLDACLQTSTSAILAGERSTLKDVMILARIDDMVINAVPRDLGDGLSVAEARWTGRGRKDKSQSWATDVDIHDPSTGSLFLRVRGLEHVRLDVEVQPDPHVFHAVRWRPDLSLMTHDQLIHDLLAGGEVAPPGSGPGPGEHGARQQVARLLDLIAHKTPCLCVLEVDLGSHSQQQQEGPSRSSSSLWHEPAGDASVEARAACQQYDYASPDAKALVAAETAHGVGVAAGGGDRVRFHLLAPDRDDLGLPSPAPGPAYDLVIVRAASARTAALDHLVARASRLVRAGGCMVVVPVPADGVNNTHATSTLTPKWHDVGDKLAGLSQNHPAPSTSAGTGSQSPSEMASGDESISSSPVLVTPGTGANSSISNKGAQDQDQDQDQDTVAEHMQPWGNSSSHEAGVQVLAVPGVLGTDSPVAYLYRKHNSLVSQPSRQTTGHRRHLVVARFDDASPPLGPALRSALTASDWSISTARVEDLTNDHWSTGKESNHHHHHHHHHHQRQQQQQQQLTSAAAVLVVDELTRPLLTTISPDKWDALRRLLLQSAQGGRPVLWVTQGAQTDRVTAPDNALVQGLFRVVRREDPSVRLATLDVQSPASASAHWAIQQVLGALVAGGGACDDDLRDDGEVDTKLNTAAAAETEYAERDGLLLVPRVMPDRRLNEIKAAERGSGLELVEKPLRANPAQVRLQADHVGTLQSLKWCETATGPVPVEAGKVEMEVMAVGVNFKVSSVIIIVIHLIHPSIHPIYLYSTRGTLLTRVGESPPRQQDVATTMGIVPENEHMIGCECAGFVKRVGPGVTSFAPGDRVVAQTNGTYVNRLQCVADRVHRIPDSLSFEDAATIPLVYLTAIYSLFHLGNLKEGQVRERQKKKKKTPSIPLLQKLVADTRQSSVDSPDSLSRRRCRARGDTTCKVQKGRCMSCSLISLPPLFFYLSPVLQ